MRVLFRLDANDEVGLGHAMRCLALAQALLDAGHHVTLLTLKSTKSALFGWHDELARRPENLELISSTGVPGSQQDIGATVACTRAQQCDWLVLDSYAFDYPAQRSLAKCGPEILRLHLDDEFCEQFAPAISLNQNCQPDGSKRQVVLVPDGSTVALSGLDYFLARRALREVRLRRLESNDTSGQVAPTILVTMGGADLDNVGLTVVQELEGDVSRSSASSPDVVPQVVLACTATAPGQAAAKAYASNHPSLTVHCRPNLLDLMADADVAICSGGVTSIEMAAVGIVPIVMVTAENQAPGANELCNAGAAALEQNPHAAALRTNALLKDSRARAAIADTGKTLIDCGGANRVVDEMISLWEARGC